MHFQLFKNADKIAEHIPFRLADFVYPYVSENTFPRTILVGAYKNISVPLCFRFVQVWMHVSFRSVCSQFRSNYSLSPTFVGFVQCFQRESNFRRSKIDTPIYRFLSVGLLQETVLLASYPRSGNSFLRRLLEQRTGIVTGSDSRSNRTLSASLLRCGYQGEGITDKSVWVVKTHYPERMGYIRFNASRIILLVRNPFDAIESYFHMGMTNTHDKTLTIEVTKILKNRFHLRERVINFFSCFGESTRHLSTCENNG